jgi:uroporphyrinogen decarboxylase
VPRLVEMGLDVLNPVQPECMDIQWLKDNFGDSLAFWGGITTQTVLPFGTPDEVRQEARRVRDILGKDGGYIFSSSQDLQSDVSPENILALIEIAREMK